MSLSAQFSLALELSNIFPIRTVVESAATQLLTFARELRKSGSDIVVEEDLAAVFGRGRISPELADKFRDAVKVQTFVPLTRGGEIRLDSGAGPTMHRALRERRYFATVVQLSLLAWMQPREKVAAMLASCMTKRLDMGVQDASDPGYEGIVKTLAACSSQSSNFAWSFYVQQVEAKLRSCIPDYRFLIDYVGLSDTLLLGAMDYLYLVQSLPDHRKILISDQKGCLTLVVWAHYVLGLTVAVVSGRTPDKNVLFGDSGPPQVIISWQECEDRSEHINHNLIGVCRNHSTLLSPSPSTATDAWIQGWSTTTTATTNTTNTTNTIRTNKIKLRGVAPIKRLPTRREPDIRLLDQDMSVILQSSPEEQGSSRIGLRSSYDRHPLLGYGTVCLRRTCNLKHIAPDNDPVYEDSVNLVTALAIHVSRRLVRTFEPACQGEHESESIPRYEIQLEAWRVLASSTIIFAGFRHDPAAVNSYVEVLSDSVLDDYIVPGSFASFLQKAAVGNVSLLETKGLLSQIQCLARIVLLFAFVVEVESCAEMPVLLDHGSLELMHELNRICRNPNTRAVIAPETIFNGIIRLLSLGSSCQRHDKWVSSAYSQTLFLWSDFGWSVFLGTTLDKDPAEVKPHLIHIRKGVPTNARTNERKRRIGDGYYDFPSDLPRAYCEPPEETESCLPRAVAQVTRRSEYWTSRAQQFEMILIYTFEAVPHSGLECFNIPPVEDWMTCRRMHHHIWQTVLTPPCAHDPEPKPKSPLDLGSDAVALLGWTDIGGHSQRVVVFLTRGDPCLRWLAVGNAAAKIRAEGPGNKREAMLRTRDCCDKCALEHVSSLPGRWILIL